MDFLISKLYLAKNNYFLAGLVECFIINIFYTFGMGAFGIGGEYPPFERNNSIPFQSTTEHMRNGSVLFHLVLEPNATFWM
jgi:hypothetical protein